MGKQRMLHLRRKSDRRLRRKILGRNGTYQPHDTKHDHDKTHSADIPSVGIPNPLINNRRHNKRHQQLKGSLQQLKQRRQNRLLLIILQENK